MYLSLSLSLSLPGITKYTKSSFLSSFYRWKMNKNDFGILIWENFLRTFKKLQSIFACFRYIKIHLAIWIPFSIPHALARLQSDNDRNEYLCCFHLVLVDGRFRFEIYFFLFFVWILNVYASFRLLLRVYIKSKQKFCPKYFKSKKKIIFFANKLSHPIKIFVGNLMEK